MNITFIGICLGLLLLCIPACIIYYFQIGLQARYLKALGRMLFSLGITGGFLYYVFTWNNVWINILWVILMILAASFTTIGKARMNTGKFLVPVISGTLVTVLVTVLYLVFLVFGVKNPFDARFLIPVSGFLIGSIMETNYLALREYYVGLHNHSAVYYYLLGNGATHGEAVRYFVKRALERAMLPGISHISYIVIGVTPLILWSMALAGIDIVTAILIQAILLAAMLAVAPLSLLIALYVAKRYAFDEYQRVNKVFTEVDVVKKNDK